jgi:tryptophanyl-tRNA synthetase
MNCTIRYGDMKKQLAEDMIKFISPVRAQVNDILQDENRLASVMKIGKEKAQASAAKTVKEVREIIGIRY